MRAYLAPAGAFVPSEPLLIWRGMRFGIPSCSELVSPTLYETLAPCADVLLNDASLSWGRGS